jgi:hypothetical protein
MKDIKFVYCLNLTFKDENQYYGLEKCLLVMCKNMFKKILWKNS